MHTLRTGRPCSSTKLDAKDDRRFSDALAYGLRRSRKPARFFENTGGAEGGRTLGLLTASQALSQLSYSPTRINLYNVYRRLSMHSQ